MPDSPLKQLKTGIVTLEITIGSTKISSAQTTLEVEVVKEVNKIPYARVVLFDGDITKQKYVQSEEKMFDIGGDAEIKVMHDPTGTAAVIFKGIVTEHGIKLSPYSGTCLEIICRDAAQALTVGRRSIVFKEDDDDKKIIEAVIKECAPKLKATVKDTTVTHKSMVQYYSTGWDFIQARADANGLVTIINDGDITIAKPTVSEKTDIIVTFGTDLIEMDLKMDASHQYKEVGFHIWDPTKQEADLTGAGKKPTVNKHGDVTSDKLSSVLEHKEVVQTTALITDKALQAWADSVYQRGHLSRVRGYIKCIGSEKIEVGKTVELAYLGKHFDGDGYISRVVHSIKGGQWMTEAGFGLPQRTHLETYPGATPLGAGGFVPAITGLQHGVVKDIVDKDGGEFRVLVNIPIIDGLKGDGVWARMAHVYATEDCGFVFYPEVGDEVVLGFFDNNPAHPVILGSMYSSKRKITTEEKHEPADPNKFKAISINKGKTRLEFADDPGKNIVTIITEDKMMVEINDDKDSITIDDPINKNTVTMDSKGITMKIDKDLTLDVTGDIKMTAGKGITMEASQDIAGKGMNIKMEADVNFEAKGGAAFKAEGAQFEIKGSGMGKVDGGGMLTVKGGMVMIN